ncbi:hypothetical protein AB0M44_08875 [Streptosporangium subroseum]|uniref:hypothetical protein n=1 Tax=Streptosporangium subroseum TaxID=106412 RepID=UPI003426D1B7
MARVLSSGATGSFYVAVEGEVTEPDYLAYLNREFGEDHDFFIHTLSVGNGLKPRPCVEKVLEYEGEVRDHEIRRFAATSAADDKALKGDRVEALKERHGAARSRARRMTDDCSASLCSKATGHATHCDPLNRDPSTDVWRLLTELGIL